MSFGNQARVEAAKFSEVLEAIIAEDEGLFEEAHPFLRTACRGLAGRLSKRDHIVPMGFVNVTELYLYDMATGVDGFTGEPMPSDVTGMPPVMGSIVRLTAVEIAREAFGDEFANAVKTQYEEMRNQQK